MKHLAAYLLAVLGGKASPSGADVTKILESVGVTADSAELDRLTAALEGKVRLNFSARGASAAAVRRLPCLLR